MENEMAYWLFDWMISLRRHYTGFATLSFVWRLYWMEDKIGWDIWYILLMHQWMEKWIWRLVDRRESWIWKWTGWKELEFEIWIEKIEEFMVVNQTFVILAHESFSHFGRSSITIYWWVNAPITLNFLVQSLGVE